MNLRAQPNAAEAAADNNGSYDFGAVSALDTPEVLHTFLLRNDSGNPLVLQRLQPSCGCTLALAVPARDAFDEDGDAVPMNQKDSAALQTQVDRRAAVHMAAMMPSSSVRKAEPPVLADTDLPTLAPGSETAVRVVVDLRLLTPGSVSKTVSVYAQGNPAPLALLRITGALKSPISFSPQRLDLGELAANRSHSVTLTATIDPRIVPSGGLPALVSSNPALRITPAGQAEATKDGQLVRSYRVTVPADFASGPLLTNIFYAPTPTEIPVAINAPSTLLHNASVMLTGQVVGDVDVAEPGGAVSLGSITQGHPIALLVPLSIRPEADLSGAKVITANSWLQARIVDTPNGRQLQLTVGPDAPRGSLRSQVMITTQNGQQTLLPVSAYVGR